MIREINQNDRDIFIEMVNQFYHSPAVLHHIPSAHAENTFTELMNQSPYVKGYLFELEGNIAGYGLLAITYSNEAGGLVVWIDEILILEAYRGKGLGTEFLAFVQQQFPQAKRFRLEVTKENTRAAKLYQSLKYESLNYLQMVLER